MVEPSAGSDKITSAYDYIIMTVIFASLVPLAFKSDHIVFYILDKICISVFIVDYILRWITADYKFNKKSVVSFIKYPFSLMSIVDLISILPSFTVVSKGFKVLRMLRMIKILKVFRVFKALRYSRSVEIIVNILNRSKDSLVAVCTLAVAYILIAALVIFNVEPDSFDIFLMRFIGLQFHLLL